MSNTILKEFIDGVLLITLNRPQRKNAFSGESWLALAATLDSAREDSRVACVVLVGAGDDFSSGMDLADFSSGDGNPAEEQPFYQAQRAVLDFDKPMIGAAKGIAIGGGATLLFHCDLVYVGQSLRMRLPFVSLGLVPEFASSYLLQANIGAQRAAELMYTAEWIDADKAVDVGIARQKYPDSELLQRALEKAREIAQWPVRSLQETKRCMKVAHAPALEAAVQLEKEGMEKMAGSPENVEAVMAFLEKRKADFKNI
jgi:enoyl-CoA hydratase/carnithine racemase